jgi:hypothetical protein
MDTREALNYYEATAFYSFAITGIFFNMLVLYVAFTCVDFSVKANQVGVGVSIKGESG